MTTKSTNLMRVWAAWLAASVLLLSYYALWVVATEPRKVTVVLQPQSNVHVEVVSPWGHWIGFEMWFHRNPRDRREADLGSYASLNNVPAGKLIFPNPGKYIAATVTLNGGPAVELEAMPASGYTETEIRRQLTANKSTANGVWNWPNRGAPRIWAPPGRNDVSLTITGVAPSLTGERVTLWTKPPLSFMSGQEHYRWLWYAWFLCPLGGLALGITGLGLLWKTLRTRLRVNR